MAACHHMVSQIAIPTGDLTKWCDSAQNSGMDKDREYWTEVRRSNLREYVRLHCADSIADLIRKLAGKHGIDSYWRNVLSKTSKKSFSMEKASEIEPALGLLPGELIRENSDLLLDPARNRSYKEEVESMIDRMEPEDHLEMVNYAAKLIRRRMAAKKKEQDQPAARKRRA